MYTGPTPHDTSSPTAPTTDWWDGLLSDSRAAVEGLIAEPPLAADELATRVATHAERLRRSDHLDGELADQLVGGLLAFVEAARAHAALLPTATVVVRYFEDDLEEDTSTTFGLDDDAEVFNAACRACGLSHLRVC
ncbi:MAG: hypothetical protein ACI8PZ_005404 [Myxococcota bacterium]